MSLLDKLEAKFPGIAFPGLMRTVTFLMLTTFGLKIAEVMPMETWLLQGRIVMDGQFWRLITFLFVPTSDNPFFLLLELMILVMVGDGLESAWGSFRFTVYYFTGALFTIIAALIFPGEVFSCGFLNLTLFLAFATIFPDYEILLFFVIPIKVKYLGMLSGASLIWILATAPLPIKIVTLFSVGNYLLFFGGDAFHAVKSGAGQYQRRTKSDALQATTDTPRHSCVQCGRTEKSHPELEFRYCTCPKCAPDARPFCLEHLTEHKIELQTSAKNA